MQNYPVWNRAKQTDNFLDCKYYFIYLFSFFFFFYLFIYFFIYFFFLCCVFNHFNTICCLSMSKSMNTHTVKFSIFNLSARLCNSHNYKRKVKVSLFLYNNTIIECQILDP